ncbi:ubiquitin-conjugating enzyme E2C-binding protein [Poronia punctata]|nr:ubiquitin-conjugating enzyme E2C-binding protein [Poronia punctata]
MPLSPQHILLYAELLSNIRQVSVGCTLPTPVSETTKATVASDGRSLTVVHDGQSQSIRLPGIVVSLPLTIQRTGGTNLSWRLPLSAPPSNVRALHTSEESVPWSATDLGQGSAVTCRACRSTIVESGTLKVWKDLPSENWAEMMEFWHCHKPHEHKHSDGDGDEHLANRGYGASSRITAQSGVGFVDLASFLLARQDIVESSITASTDNTELTKNESKDLASSMPGTLHCSSCKQTLGVRNDDISSISLFKWQVLVKHQAQNTSESAPSLAQCVCAMLLATMARSGCSKSILVPIKAGTVEGLRKLPGLVNIWVFNANITFSSTESSKPPIHGIKLFYRFVSQQEADKMLDSMTSDVQDISLPSDAIMIIAELLEESTRLVPESDRKFQQWKVGLLEKWDGKGG